MNDETKDLEHISGPIGRLVDTLTGADADGGGKGGDNKTCGDCGAFDRGLCYLPLFQTRKTGNKPKPMPVSKSHAACSFFRPGPN